MKIKLFYNRKETIIGTFKYVNGRLRLVKMREGNMWLMNKDGLEY